MYMYTSPAKPVVKYLPVYHWPHTNKKALGEMFLD